MLTSCKGLNPPDDGIGAREGADADAEGDRQVPGDGSKLDAASCTW